MTAAEWELSYMNVPAFMCRLFALRIVRHELRAHPSMKIENFGLNAGSRDFIAISVVRDYRLPPYVCVLTELSSGTKQVLVFRPEVPVAD